PAGTHQVDRLAGLSRRGPLACDAVLTVHDDVQRDLVGSHVDLTHGDGAHRGLFLGGQGGKAVQSQWLGQFFDTDVVRDEYQLHVGVGEFAGNESAEIPAPQHYSNHVRCELFGTDDFEALQWSTCHLILLSRPRPPVDYTSRGVDAAWPLLGRYDPPPPLVAPDQPRQLEDGQRSQHLPGHQPRSDRDLVDRGPAAARQRLIDPTLGVAEAIERGAGMRLLRRQFADAAHEFAHVIGAGRQLGTAAQQ